MKQERKGKQEATPEQALEPKAEQALVGGISAADKVAMYGDLDNTDITIPRLTVLQALSPEVSDGLGKVGMLFVKGLNRELGKEVEVIPLIRSRSRIRWKPMQEGGGIVCQAIDGKVGVGDPGGSCEACPMAQWQGSAQPLCDLYQNVILVLRQDEDWIPMALSGSRTKLRALRDLNTLFTAEMLKGRPLFMKSYLIRVIEKANKGNASLKYFSFRVLPGNNNLPLPAEEVVKAQALFDSLKTKSLQVSQEHEGAEPTNPEL